MLRFPFITSEAWRMTFAGLGKAAQTDLFCIIHANAGTDGRVNLGSLKRPENVLVQKESDTDSHQSDASQQLLQV